MRHKGMLALGLQSITTRIIMFDGLKLLHWNYYGPIRQTGSAHG